MFEGQPKGLFALALANTGDACRLRSVFESKLRIVTRCCWHNL